MKGLFMHGFGNGWSMGFGWFIGLAFIIVLFLLIVKLFNQSASSDGNKTQTPLEILKTRYAKGEIDEEEFKKRKRALNE